MAKWRERFAQLGTEISKHPLLIVDRLVLDEPASKDDIRAAEKAVGAPLPEGMREFYGEINGFRLQWHARDPNAFDRRAQPSGRIELLKIGTSVGEVFASWDDEIWFSKDGDERFKAVKPVDFFIAESCAALYPVPGDMTIHFHDLGEDLHPTGYSFLEYLELLMKSRGYLYWQTALCVDTQGEHEAKTFRTNMPRLFADYDDNTFKPNTTQGEIKSRS